MKLLVKDIVKHQSKEARYSIAVIDTRARIGWRKQDYQRRLIDGPEDVSRLDAGFCAIDRT